MESWRPDFAAVKASGVLLDENPHWPGSYFVDIRNPAWQKRILDTLAPAVWTQGFHGFFLDTLDDPGPLEPLDPVRYKGMTAAAAKLVPDLPQLFPTPKNMLTRPFELPDAVETDIAFVHDEGILDKRRTENRHVWKE